MTSNDIQWHPMTSNDYNMMLLIAFVSEITWSCESSASFSKCLAAFRASSSALELWQKVKLYTNLWGPREALGLGGTPKLDVVFNPFSNQILRTTASGSFLRWIQISLDWSLIFKTQNQLNVCEPRCESRNISASFNGPVFRQLKHNSVVRGLAKKSPAIINSVAI